MRNPEAPGWPDHGERTELEQIGQQWKWAYLALVRDEHRRRVLGLGRSPRTLREASDAFLKHRESTVESATLSCDRTGTLHLLRHFGGPTRTNTITAPLLQELVNALYEEGYKPSTLDTYARSWRIFLEFCHFGVCGKALRQNANKRRMAEFFDPVAELSIPDPGRTDIETLSDIQIKVVMAAAADGRCSEPRRIALGGPGVRSGPVHGTASGRDIRAVLAGHQSGEPDGAASAPRSRKTR